MKCPCGLNCGFEVDDQLVADSVIPGLADWLARGVADIAGATSPPLLAPGALPGLDPVQRLPLRQLGAGRLRQQPGAGHPQLAG
jgi:hypothetical protein